MIESPEYEDYLDMMEEMYGYGGLFGPPPEEKKEEVVEEKKVKVETVDPDDTSYQYGFK